MCPAPCKGSTPAVPGSRPTRTCSSRAAPAAEFQYRRKTGRMLWVSTRQRFQHGDPEWDGYITWIALPQLREVRTLDAALNKYVDKCGSLYCELSEIGSV